MTKKKVRGICKLCLLDKELQDSHLMPRSLYKKSRNPLLKNSDPLVVTVDGAKQSSYQLTDYVFCRDCEQLFSTHGENYVMPLVEANGKFKLLEDLQKAPADVVTTTVNGYSVAHTPGIDRDKIAYFAASVFWRASVHLWRYRDSSTTTIDMGKRYNEEFRQYLLGNAPFPQNATLTTVVCTDPFSQIRFFMPGENVKSKQHVHIVMARGLTFFLGVGRDIPAFLSRYCIVHSPERWIVTRDCSKPHPIWELGKKL